MAFDGESLVFLVGDNDQSLEKFQRTLRGLFPEAGLMTRSRTEFWSLISDNLARNSKFIFVFPLSPRQIIYDESHPSRSFHKEINRAESPPPRESQALMASHAPARDSVLIVVYGDQNAPSHSLFDHEIERLYRTGSQPELAKFANRSRILSLRDSLNWAQINELSAFLHLRPRQTECPSCDVTTLWRGCQCIWRWLMCIVYILTCCCCCYEQYSDCCCLRCCQHCQRCWESCRDWCHKSCCNCKANVVSVGERSRLRNE